MNLKKQTIIKYLIIISIAIIIVVLIVFVSFNRQYNNYQEKFSGIQPGMTKAEIYPIIGSPNTVDTFNLEYEVWIYDVPAIFAERPHLYFTLRDSVLIRFVWEPIDIWLDDSLKIKK